MAVKAIKTGTGMGIPGRGGAIYGGKAKDTKGTLSKLLQFLRQSRHLLLVVCICVLVSSSATLYGTYAIKPVIQIIEDALVKQYSYTEMFITLQPLLVFIFIVYMFGVAAAFLQQRIMIIVSQRTVKKMREDLYHKMIRFPMPTYDRYANGELMSHFTNDIDLISEALNSSIVQLIDSMITLIGTFAIMLFLNVWLTLVTMVAIPLLAFLVNRIAKRSRRNFSGQQQAIGDMNGYIEEAMEGLRIIQLFGQEDKALAHFKETNDRYRQQATKAQAQSGLMMPLVQNLNAINYACIVALGGFLTIQGKCSISSLGAFANLTRRFNKPINEIANQFTTMQSALAACERVFALMELDVEETNGAILDDVAGDVRFEHVDFGYLPSKLVLRDISLHARAGEKIALVGSTGAGKTTIANLITRFYPIQQGSILLDGVDMRALQPTFIRQQMAMVLQDTHLFATTILENIRYGRLDASDEECIAAAKLANAHSFIMRLQQEYHTLIHKDGSELSQGQRQLINIARAAVANPKLLILDEATSSIDTHTEQLIQKGMDRLMKGRTTFIIAHRLSTIVSCDQILVMENGGILEQGTHAQLLEQKGRYYELYHGHYELS